MATLTITIDTDNAAFEDQPEYEVARILRELANGIEKGYIDDNSSIRDRNGNTVGQLTTEEEN